MSTEATDDFDNMEEDMDVTGYEEAESGPLFWSMKLEPNKSQEIDQPAIGGYIVHVTNACFGANVTKQSRTVVMVNPSAEENDTSLLAPVCVLRQGQHENHSLDLLFNESATITVKGQKPSVVWLTGYIQPPVEPTEQDIMDPMYEDMDEEQIEAALREQRRQQIVLDDEDGDDEEPQLIDDDDNDDDDINEPPTKKQKTSTGSKSTKNGGKSEAKKRKSPQQKANKSPQQKPTPSPLSSDDKKEESDSDKKKKKKKNMQNMKGGIRYRDMKIGEGKQVANGDKLKVYYVGQTDNKKVFDKCISGGGFEFNFGKGDVIKGWDMGLKGMRVGGKRKLVIPSKLGYGSNGSPPSIPPNSILTFTIEVKAAN